MATNWAPIKNDSMALDEFSIFLTSCENAMKATQGLHELNMPHNMRMIIEKLQPALQDRWRRCAFDISDRGQVVQFSNLAKFVRREAAIATDALFGKDAGKPIEKYQKKVLTTSVTNDVAQADAALVDEQVAKSREAECPYCQDSHRIDECVVFSERTHAEKMDFIRKTQRCFGCLRKGHTARFCRSRKTCTECRGRHPTQLHQDRRPNEVSEQTSTGAAQDKTRGGSSEPATVGVGKVNTMPKEKTGAGSGMSIIPVRVRTNTGPVVTTHALLDSGSSATFCTQSLLEKLQYKDAVPTKLTLSTVQTKCEQVDNFVVSGLQIAGLDENEFMPLPPVYTLDDIPVSQEDILNKEDIERWPHLRELSFPTVDADIELMIGNNAPACMEPWDIVHGPKENAPFAVKTRMGWVACGPVKASSGSKVKVNRVQVDGERLDEMLNRMYSQDFPENASEGSYGPSEEDRLWLIKTQATCVKVEGGRYEIGLPFREEDIHLPNNKGSAQRRLSSLKKRLQRDDRFSKDYRGFMQGMIDKGHAEKVPPESLNRDDGKVWYIPHHGIYHLQKPEKIRVVFDCSARFRDKSLNDCLLQGPDLTNSLLDVLIRFREHRFAFIADVEAMFYQVLVPANDRDCLRYLWWTNGDTSTEPEDFRMRVHLFGAISSPRCANYALHRSVDDAGELVDSVVADTMRNNFYVDDCLKSVTSEEDAIVLAKGLKDVCIQGGFNLTKFVSNSRELLKSLPEEDRGKQLRTLDMSRDLLPVERALGVYWTVESDELEFRAAQKNKPATRRGMLSTIGSMYDPLGMVSPLTLKGRLIFQELTRLQLGWDDDIPALQKQQWQTWLHDLPKVANVSVARCVKPDGFGHVARSELHHFADTSESAYATASYLRLINEKGDSHCAFIFGKVRVAPLNKISIPRLELTAATMAVRMNGMLIKALEADITKVRFWTDSTTVLRYIRNDVTRYHTFVSNRLAVIKDGSTRDQWRFVGTKLNVADDGTRGEQSSRWLRGPEFLYQDESHWPEEPLVMSNEVADPEVKGEAAVGATSSVEPTPTQRLIGHYSSWFKLKKAVAWWRRLPAILRARKAAGTPTSEFNIPITLRDMEQADLAIIRAVQAEAFSEEISELLKGSSSGVQKASPLWRLDPRLSEGALYVGGRLRSARTSSISRHPWLLPHDGHVTDLVIRHAHAVAGHQGREHVLSSLREKYWIVRGNSAVRRELGACVVCRKNQGPPLQQKMADLPQDRLSPDEQPFTSVGTDLFGPFLRREGEVR